MNANKDKCVSFRIRKKMNKYTTKNSFFISISCQFYWNIRMYKLHWRRHFVFLLTFNCFFFSDHFRCSCHSCLQSTTCILVFHSSRSQKGIPYFLFHGYLISCRIHIEMCSCYYAAYNFALFFNTLRSCIYVFASPEKSFMIS